MYNPPLAQVPRGGLGAVTKRVHVQKEGEVVRLPYIYYARVFEILWGLLFYIKGVQSNFRKIFLNTISLPSNVVAVWDTPFCSGEFVRSFLSEITHFSFTLVAILFAYLQLQLFCETLSSCFIMFNLFPGNVPWGRQASSYHLIKQQGFTLGCLKSVPTIWNVSTGTEKGNLQFCLCLRKTV